MTPTKQQKPGEQEFRVDMSVDNPKALDDWMKAFLFTYVLIGSLPEWANGNPMLVLAILCGWSQSRAEKAFFKAEEMGHIQMELRPHGDGDDVVLQ